MASNIFENGTIVAAPSQVSSENSNDYYYMWQRDAAMTMTTLLRLVVEAPGEVFPREMSDRSSPIRARMLSYAGLLPRQWNQSNPNSLCPPWYRQEAGWCPTMGEPKYFVNGSIYDKPWGRPQNDGPAIAGIFLAELLGAMVDVRDEIPGNELRDLSALLLGVNGTSGVLYEALNFVNTWYHEGSTDPWEEVYGRTFFVSEVQRQALFEGASAAERVGRNQTAQWPKSGYPNWVYSAHDIKSVSLSFVQDLVSASVGRQQGLAGPKCINSEVILEETGEVWSSKAQLPCELDVQTLIAANLLQGSLRSDPVLPPHDHRMLDTARHVFASMAPHYEVNAMDRSRGLKGMLIGRYPGDTYCGYGQCTKDDFGNPWFIATHALAEQMYFVAQAWCEDRLSVKAARSLHELMTEMDVAGMSALEAGDAIMKNAKAHVHMPGVHMSEQIKKNGPHAGEQVGVPDLTWSYSSALSALTARHRAIQACREQ